MSSYVIDLRFAQSALHTLGSVEGELDEVLTDLRWRVQRLHSTWSGRSADAHLVVHQRWAAAYAEMQAALERMRAAVDTAQANYSGAAQANRALWESVR